MGSAEVLIIVINRVVIAWFNSMIAVTFFRISTGVERELSQKVTATVNFLG